MFQAEAVLVGLKEGAKLSLAYLVVRAYLSGIKREDLVRFVSLAVFLLPLISVISLLLPVLPETQTYVSMAVGYSFGLIYLVSLGFLYSTVRGEDLWGILRPVMVNRFTEVMFLFFMATFFIVPDLSGTLLFIKSMAQLKETVTPYINMAVAFLFSGFLIYLLFKNRLKRLSSLLALPQVLLVLAMIKLVGGGTKGFAELSLIPAVQKGLMKLIHDIVHQTFVTLMVPDHPILKTTTWNFIGILFGERVSLWLSLFVLFAPLFAFVLSYLQAPVDVPEGIEVAAKRRKYIRGVKNRRLLRTIPVFAFMILILTNWFAEGGESMSTLYNPEPVPVVAESGKVVIPINTPEADLRDGAVHKFTVDIKGESIRFIVIKKDDGSLAVCLDACEVCPPEGYAQGEGYLVCLYCRTPINTQSLGKAGGCNPIPLKALVTAKNVEIDVDELVRKWDFVKTGKSKNLINK